MSFMSISHQTNDIEVMDDTQKNVQNLGTCPKLSESPLTPLWEHKNLGT